MSKRRKRIKLECLECGSTFDDDYKLRYEKTMHEGRQIKVKHSGAPANPFEASRRKKVETEEAPSSALPLQVQISDDAGYGGASSSRVSRQTPVGQGHGEERESSPPTFPSSQQLVEPSSLSCTQSLVQLSPNTGTQSPALDEDSPALVNDRRFPVIEETSPPTQPPPSAKHAVEMHLESASDFSHDSEFSWVSYAGQVSELCSNLGRVRDLLNKMKNEPFPTPKIFLVDVIDCLSIINKESSDLLEIANTHQEHLFSNASEQLDVDYGASVEHDPGRRQRITLKNQRKYLISLGPFQPKLSAFPNNKDVTGHKQHHFNPGWYSEFPMLEYSIDKDAAFCFCCSLFPEGPGRSNARPEWVSVGVRDWHKMKSRGKNKMGKLAAHFSSEPHLAALGDYCLFLTDSHHVDILLNKQLRQERIKEEQEKVYHRKILCVLTDVARTLGRQGLAFRGHGDEAGLEVNSNFYQIVSLISRHCPLVKKWLQETEKRPGNITYMSGKSQNEFIDLLGKETRKAVVKDVTETGLFAVLADTTPDMSHKDRLAINVRYVVDKGDELVPVERILKTDVVLEKKTGEELASKIFKGLNAEELPIEKLVFQSYDFAANMSGIYNGTQEKLSQKCNRSIPYIPCQAHRLNIFTEAACEACAIIRAFFDILEALYVFFTGSTKRYIKLENELSEIENSLHLRNLSKTRWIFRAESVKAVDVSFESIIKVLEKIKSSQEYDSKTRCSATGLYKKMLDFDFICCLYFCKNIMYKIKNVTEALERETLNVVDCIHLLESTSTSFGELNDDVKINALVQSAAAFAEKLNIDPVTEFNRHHRTRRPPRNLDDCPETAAEIDFLTFYRKEIKAVLDTFNSLTKTHFDSMIKLLKPFHEIFQIPASRKNCKIDQVQTMVDMFPEILKDEAECLHAELEILLDSCRTCTNFHEISQIACRLRNAIPKAFGVVRLILTAPVSSSSCERSFSKLKLIYNYLRTTMGDDRLDMLMQLISARDKVDKLDLESIVKQWSVLKHRRLQT